MGEDAEEEEQEFEFRLFSSVSTRKTADESRSTTKGHDGSGLGGVQKLRIRLRSPSPSARPLGDGGFLVPFRGWDYYFSNPELVMRAVGDTSWQRGAKDKNTSKQLDALRDTFKDTAVDGETILARAASVAWVCTAFSGFLAFWISLLQVLLTALSLVAIFRGESYIFQDQR